jgi:glycosyltransferase involved in cell wall biosynthesis
MKLAINAMSLQRGGGLTVLLGLLDGLSRAQPHLETTVLACAQETVDAVQASGNADVIATCLQNAGTARTFLWQNLALGKHLRANHFDLLLAVNHYLTGIPCPQVVYHLNLRRFSREHRSTRLWDRVQEGVRDWSARQALHRATVNVFESEYLRQAAERMVPGQTGRNRVIYIGLPDATVDHATTMTNLSGGEPRLIAVTSPLPHKDNPTMLRTVAELVRQWPDVDWHLDVVGGTDPNAWAPFRQLAAQLGIADRVTWHGYCDQKRLNELLRRSLCMLSTSCLESFAMVAVEAMARRCPPIVARTAAMPESVGSAGVLVSPGDEREFADAVYRIYSQPTWRSALVDRGLHWIQRLRWSACGRQFANVFSEATGRTAAA